jgi:glycine cleavage system aminomethyltransferase T
VGEVTSAGWGYEAGRVVALGYIRGHWAQQDIQKLHAQAELWGVPVDVVIQEAA